MSIPALLVCPNCRFKFELEQAIQEVEGRQFVELLTSLPPPVQRPLYNYTKLFTPEKHAMSWNKSLKVTKELAPMIKDAKIERNKVTYAAPVPVWVAALSYLVETPPATLTLPLKGNGYLLTILVAQAEKAVADAAEQHAAARQSERAYANRAVAETVKQVQSHKVEAGKQSQEDKPKLPPIDPEWKKQLFGMMAGAARQEMTAEQKAENLRKLEKLKAEAAATMSDAEKERIEQMRRDKRAFEQSFDKPP
jgi:hypothetical protein